MDFLKSETVLNLDNIRSSLIRMEDTIVFNLIERAQFYETPSIYDAGKIPIPDFDGSFLDWVILETEKMHSKIRRFEAPDQIAFFPNDLEKPILPSVNYAPVIAPFHKEISVNEQIKEYYIKEIVPKVAAVKGEQSENFGSCALCDMDCLDSLSRRIHFGKFVAESKFRSDRDKYTKLIKSQDAKGINEAITNEKVEQMVLDRIGSKAETYGAPVLRYSQMAQGEITSSIIVKIYKDCVIPLTKKVEVDYLLRRLEWDDTA